MTSIAKLSCGNCDNVRWVSEDWLRQRFPELVGKSKAQQSAALRAASKHLVCGMCGSVSPRVEQVMDQPQSSPPRDIGNDPVLVQLAEREAKLIGSILREERSWLYQRERSMLESLCDQVAGGRTLSDKQLGAVEAIRESIKRRKKPRLLQGGSPGLSRRGKWKAEGFKADEPKFW